MEVCPFGLKNALAKFQRIMDWVLASFSFAKCYINDIIVFNLTLKEHLQEVFHRLNEHNFKLYHGKCQLFHIQVEYVGRMIYLGGLVQKAKIEAISQVPQPTIGSWLRTFLSLCNYYWRFVKGFNNIAKLLTQSTQIDYELIWGEAQKHAFQKLKTRPSSTHILRQPIQGWSFQLHIDWNTLRLGVALTQFDDDDWKFVMAYASWFNNKMKAKYNLYEGECFEVI